MSKQITIAIVSHALCIPEFRKRWEVLANDNNFKVHLLIPRVWEQTWFGEKVIYKTSNYTSKNLYIHAMPTTSQSNWSSYFFLSIDCKLNQIKPDLLYVIQEETILIHHQLILARNIFSPDTKMFFFSMNALGQPGLYSHNPLKKFIYSSLWNHIRSNYEAALAHYPGCLHSLRTAGFKKPIFLQTQVGVNEETFRPNIIQRNQVREELGISQSFVIGYAGRLVEDKGVDTLVQAFIQLAKRMPEVYLLLVGNGPLKSQILCLAEKANLSKRIIITGFVPQDKVPEYMNAMDLFVLGSKTTNRWIDTFPLVTVQAQAVGLPVIAASTGSIPWQLSDSALLFSESDVSDLIYKIEQLITNKRKRILLSQKGQERSLELFCHRSMTQNFVKITSQILSGCYDFNGTLEHYQQCKCY